MNDKVKLIMSMVVFGTIGIFVRYIPYTSGIIAMTRGIVGALFLILFICLTHKKFSWESIGRNVLLLILTGSFIGINWILLFEAYRYTTVATATLCYYLAPVFMIIASPFVFKEKITPIKFLAICLALLGMVLVSGVYKGFGGGVSDFYGVLFGIGAAIFYALVIILNKKLKDISAYDQTIVQLIIAGLILVPYNFFTKSFAEIPAETTGLAVVLLIFVGIVHTGITYALYFGSVQTLPAQTIAIFSYIDPVVAILISAFILKEGMDIFGIIGAVLILGSTFLTEIKWGKKRTA